MSVTPDATASSTTQWIAGRSTTGSISLGCSFVRGRNREPRPAAGITAFIRIGEACTQHKSIFRTIDGSSTRSRRMAERRLTIHHVTPHFYPEVGGLEDSVRRFGSWFVGRGHRVVVHTSSQTEAGESLPPRDSIDGIEVRRYPSVVRRGYFRTWFRPNLSGA